MYGDKFKEATKSLMSYCREQMGYDNDPDVHYVTDSNNANNMLGYTAHYQPDSRVVTVYISNRHPKDVLRSLSHELVHHAQNCRGDLQNTQTEEGYAQKDPHMRKMEEEAYLKGNMMFRDWEDTCKEQNMILPSTIGENKMSEQLNNLIAEKVKAKLEAEGIQLDEGWFDKLRARGAGLVGGAKQAGKNLGALGRAAKAGLSGDADAAKGELDKVASVGAAKQARVLSSRAKSAYKQIGKLYNELIKDFQALGFIDEKGSSVGPSQKALTGLMAGLKQAQEGLKMVADEEKINKLSALTAKGREDLKTSLKPKEPEQQTEDALEEGGAAQRQGNEDRLRRQEPDRVKEGWEEHERELSHMSKKMDPKKAAIGVHSKKDDEDVKELKDPKKADLDKDGKLSSYEKKRGAAIEKSMSKQKGEKDDGDEVEEARGIYSYKTNPETGEMERDTEREKENDKQARAKRRTSAGGDLPGGGKGFGGVYTHKLDRPKGPGKKVTKKTKHGTNTITDVNESIENELVDIKENQSSIERLNENRLLNVNKELMRRLLK